MIRFPCISALLLAAACAAPGQTFSVLHTMAVTEGSGLYHGLAAGTDGYLYGTAIAGGANGFGSVFRVNTSGALNVLWSFSDSDGAQPFGGVIIAPDGSLYGTTNAGGAHNLGTVFHITLQTVAGQTAASLTTLHTFSGLDGSNPYGGVVLDSDGNLLGTTTGGGATEGWGTIWEITPQGAFSTVHNFHFNEGEAGFPYSGLTIIAPGVVAGTARRDADNILGGLFALDYTNGFYQTLALTGPDGTWPYSDLVSGDDGWFYGSGVTGGANNTGAVFRVNISGTLELVASVPATNGGVYQAGVIGPDGRRYAAGASSSTGEGQVLALAANGTGSLIATFTGTNGAQPTGAIILAPDGNLYGTTLAGGANGAGVIYKISF